MVSEKRSEEKLDFIKDLDAKFAALNPDSLPTLHTYLGQEKDTPTDDKPGIVTPILSPLKICIMKSKV